MKYGTRTAQVRLTESVWEVAMCETHTGRPESLEKRQVIIPCLGVQEPSISHRLVHSTLLIGD